MLLGWVKVPFSSLATDHFFVLFFSFRLVCKQPQAANDIVNIRQEARCQGGSEGRNTQFEA
jgi:hypothetical protein